MLPVIRGAHGIESRERAQVAEETVSMYRLEKCAFARDINHPSLALRVPFSRWKEDEWSAGELYQSGAFRKGTAPFERCRARTVWLIAPQPAWLTTEYFEKRIQPRLARMAT